MQKDNSIFPDPVYKRTVLAPLFNAAKTHFVDALKSVNQAHLVMLFETGIVEPQQARALARALRDVDACVDLETLTYTGEHEDYFFYIESELNHRLGPDIAGMLHTARSRNDMDHSIFKAVLKQHADKLLERAHLLADTVLIKATAERDTLIVAYTHGQPAQPTTFGHYLAAVLEVLLRDIERLHAARQALDLCPMGAAAITTTGFSIDRQRMATLLGFREPLLNSYGCIAAVDYITGWYSAIKLLFLHVGRVAQDFQFWSAFEVGQLYVPNSLVQISSIMPQKRNPVPVEHLRHLASVTCGRCDTLINTMHNTPFTDMNDSESEVQQSGYAVYDSGGRVLDLFAALIGACDVDQRRVAANGNAACITITELADALVRRELLSFRVAHQIAAKTAQAVITQGQALSEGYQSFSVAFAAACARSSKLTQAEFIEAVSARNFVNVRDRLGGPAPTAMNAALDIYTRQLNALQHQLNGYQQQSNSASIELKSAFEQLLED